MAIFHSYIKIRINFVNRSSRHFVKIIAKLDYLSKFGISPDKLN